MTGPVLAGIDLTPIGRRVAERGRMLAESRGLPLRLVSVNESLSEAFLDDGLAKLLYEQQRRNLEQVSAWCQGRTTVPVTHETLRGSIGWELVREAKRAAVVLVGTSAVDVERCGPIARRVAIMSTGDVLVVRRQPRSMYRKILAGVDFSEHSKLAVETALRWFPDTDLTAVFSLPSRWDPALAEAGLFDVEVAASRSSRMRRATERMEEFVAEWPGRVKPLVVDGPPATAIDEIVRRRGVDLVVVTNRGAGATKMVLLGTVADGVLEAMPSDVMVVRVPGDFRRP
ncbi:MAG TPA: universal stress protein [Acidimicrobiia bacterium]|nr:universal stress protein [Acidimicrobiia bacterium]